MASVIKFLNYDITGDYQKSNTTLFKYPYIYTLYSSGAVHRLNVISKTSELLGATDLSGLFTVPRGSITVTGNTVNDNTEKMYFYARGYSSSSTSVYKYYFCELDLNTFVCKSLYSMFSGASSIGSLTARVVPIDDNTIRVYHYYNYLTIGVNDYTYLYYTVKDIKLDTSSVTTVLNEYESLRSTTPNYPTYYNAPSLIRDDLKHLEYGSKSKSTVTPNITKVGYTFITNPNTIDTLNQGKYAKVGLFELDGSYYAIGGELDGVANTDIIKINPVSLSSIKIGDSINDNTVTPVVYSTDTNAYILMNSDKLTVAQLETYNLKYTFKDSDGNTLAELTDKLPVSAVNVSSAGNDVTVTLTYIDSTTETVFYTLPPRENVKFFGLSDTPNSKRAMLVEGDNSISIYNDITFYPVYIRYVVPSTTFNIELYQNSAEVNRVDKGQYLAPVGSLVGALRDECSMLTPSIVYQSESVPTFNYVYIPIFNRYYFVTSLSSVSKNVWRMELNCDVLMSYKNEILLLQGVVGRQEIDFNPMLVDSELPTQDNPEVEIVNIPSTAFKSHTNVESNFYNFVLTVIG